MTRVRSIKELTDLELVDLCKTYDIGELLSSEEDIDYIMSRIGWFFNNERPSLVSYEMTDADREHFKKIAEESDNNEEF
jgi:hypothetical protein